MKGDAFGRHAASIAAAMCALLFSLSPTPCRAQEDSVLRVEEPLPYGRWTGSLVTRNVPDVEHDGEWQEEIALVHCQDTVLMQFKREDGTYTEGFQLVAIPLRKMYLLVMTGTENPDGSGWSESQVWTLVDARPALWTLSQSRAVINQDSKPDNPWLTFRRFSWGSVEFDAEWCNRPSPQPTHPAE